MRAVAIEKFSEQTASDNRWLMKMDKMPPIEYHLTNAAYCSKATKLAA